MTRRFSVAERRARLVARHHLGTPAGSVEQIAAGLVALHATDPASVHLSAAARLREPDTAERALYEDRTLLRMLGMRRTVFVVPAGLAPVVQAACADDIAARQRKLLLQHLTTAGLDEDLDAWLADVEEGAFAALAARGTGYAAEIADGEPRLRTRIVVSRGKPYESNGYITNRVLFLLAARGRIVRGRPRGSWLSTQYEWATAESWLGGIPAMPAGQARAELARRWLSAFGPAPVEDLKWWTGWTVGQVRKALAEIGPAEVDLDGVPGIALADDLEPVPEPEPAARLLPALDPTPMGWAERDWYLGPHREALFDRSGNIGPTIWWGGRVVGGWVQRADGEIACRLLEDVGAHAEAAIRAEAERLREWLGPMRVIPKFRTPLERELAS
ncbi:winged helix DNA-binding domain-containing protein [Amycolatopsis sp. K13G38]|uniref:Winged helix DNA-binding domain-containing protein n=1 Tax=Amycolatopsis acididurans TaxID=2724524 RepID=A0ABX1J1Q3_9PSEU|nr:winged helix DNA-binding domain-containing protein [Amycolatopsis acididurans]NKQ53730.1 winged helix DNA-binding domain-containing protein [Amycolatopsis acididurans]